MINNNKKDLTKFSFNKEVLMYIKEYHKENLHKRYKLNTSIDFFLKLIYT